MTAGLILSALAALTANDYQSALDSIRESQEIPGVSAVVVRQNEELFAGGSGVADLETGRQVDADTIFYSGSVSKIFTAAVTLKIIDEGILDLEELADDIVPAKSAANNAPGIVHLLTHTSGLVREGDFGYWFSGKFPDADELSEFLARTELRSEPGEKVSYSNIGYAALGLAIEQATGQSYADALDSKLFEPLDMQSSGSPGPAPDIAVGYTPVSRIIPSEERPFAGVGEAIAGRHVREYHNAQAMSPAFGIYTSASDLGKLAQSILGFGSNRVLSDESRSLMLTPMFSNRAIAFRITEYRDHRVARHDGWFAAHRSHVLLEIDEGIAVVVLTNSDSAAPGKIAEKLMNIALKNTGQ